MLRKNLIKIAHENPGKVRDALLGVLSKTADLRLSAKDKKVINAFLDKKSAESKKLSTDGKRLDGNWMGGSKIAEWKGGKIHFSPLASRSQQTVVRAVRKIGPDNDFAKQAAREDAWAQERRSLATALVKQVEQAPGMRMPHEDVWEDRISLRFERNRPGQETSLKPFFCDVYVMTDKAGKGVYLVDPYGKKGKTNGPVRAAALVLEVLFPHGAPEPFAAVAAQIVRSFEQQWGKVKVAKAPKIWAWSMTPDEARERGMKIESFVSPKLVKPGSGSKFVWSDGRYHYKADPRIYYTMHKTGMPAHRVGFSVGWMDRVPRKVTP